MNAISHRPLLFKACLGLIALGLVNLIFLLAGKWIKPFLPVMELTDYYVLLKVAACAMIFIFISATGQYAEFGLKWRLKYNTLYLYWPIAVVACLILAGGSAQAPMLLVKLALLSLAVGLAEEVMFRGMVFHWFRFLSSRGQIMVSAISFGSVHFFGLLGDVEVSIIMAQVYFACGFGVIFASARARDASIWLAVFVHAAFDFAAFSSRGGIAETFGQTEAVIQGLVIGGTLAWIWAIFLIWKANSVVNHSRIDESQNV